MSTTRLSPSEIAARRLPLAGNYNVRDVGGYPVDGGGATRWNTLLRGDALHGLDDSGRAVLGSIGVNTVIDLREHDEVSVAPDRLGDLTAQVVHLPLYDTSNTGMPRSDQAGRTLAQTYELLVRDRPEALAGAVRALAAPGALPAIVHCTAGKDRTGIVIALALSTVGVSDSVIAADYCATEHLLDGAFRAEILARSVSRGVPEASILPLLSAQPDLILAVLNQICHDHGSVAAFLGDHGMTDAERVALRSSLVAEAPEEP